MILNEETKTITVELSDNDVISMDDSTGDIVVNFIEGVDIDDIVEVHFKEDNDTVSHKYRVTFVDGPDAVTYLQWLEMIDKRLNEANPFKTIRDKLMPDQDTKLKKAHQAELKSQEKINKKATNLFVRDVKQGANWQYYIQFPNGAYSKKPVNLKDLQQLNMYQGNNLSPAIENAVVVSDGFIVRKGKQDLDGTGTRFNAGELSVKPSFSKDWDEQYIADFKQLMKTAPKNSPVVKAYKETVAKNNQKSKKNDPTAPTDTQATEKTSKKILDQFKRIVLATGLQVVDVDDKPANISSITMDNFNDYKVIVNGQEASLPSWLKAAMNDKIIHESITDTRLQEILTEAPVIKLTDDQLLNPNKIDFKEIGKAAKEKEQEEVRKEQEKLAVAKLKLKYADVPKKLDTAIQHYRDTDEILNMLFDDLVPSEGMCDSVAGEYVRAMMRILFRDYNDGDRFFEGYGIQTCGSSANYLFDNGFSEEINNIMELAYLLSSDDDKYTDAITHLAAKVVEYLSKNTELFFTVNEVDSRDYDTSYIEENQPTYEFEITASDDVITLVEKGVLTAWDLNRYVESQLDYEYQFNGAEVARPWAVDTTSVTVTDLTKEGYDMLEYRVSRDIDAFWLDLVEEHADELSDDTYDDEYDSED